MPRQVIDYGRGTDAFPHSQREAAQHVMNDSFDHIVNIYRDTEVDSDPWGGKKSSKWTMIEEDHECRYFVRIMDKPGEIIVDSERRIVSDLARASFPLKSNVKPGDRLIDFRDSKDESPIVFGTFRVEGILTMTNHMECVLEAYGS